MNLIKKASSWLKEDPVNLFIFPLDILLVCFGAVMVSETVFKCIKDLFGMKQKKEILTFLGFIMGGVLLEILEDRYETRSTIVTSQLPIDQWHDMIGDPTLADAILDRLVHSSYKITLKGESMRKINANRYSTLTNTTHTKS